MRNGASLSGDERARYVQAMFGRIAHRYDRMNRLMTMGQDVGWRREVIRRARLHRQSILLDLGAGTGDLALEAMRQQSTAHPVAADFTLEMMQAGRGRRGAERVQWTAADALHLPFPEARFDAVVSGYLLRNVIDLRAALQEQLRVLKPGGWMVALDTTRPQRGPLSPFIDIYLHRVIPALGRLIAGDSEAYTYLPDSTAGFLSAEQLAARMVEAGLREVGFRRLMFSTMAVHWGRKH